MFRVFLKTGDALPSYGEAAIAGDRVVFTLIVGTAPQAQRDAVDQFAGRRASIWTAPNGYANALRAAHYAATRGEVDFAAMTQEVQRAIAEVTSVSDPKKRLGTGRRRATPADGLGGRHLRLPRGRGAAAERAV